MKFLSIALFALFFALSNSAYAVTAEECLDSYYQALEEYFDQPGVADNNDARCSIADTYVNLYNGASSSCVVGDRNSSRIFIRITKHKDERNPLACSWGFQACDSGRDIFLEESLDSKGDAGKARGQISRLCDYLLD